MQIQHKPYPLAISQKLVSLLTTEIEKSGIDVSCGCTLNFRDPDFSAESGGYHPVEIAIDHQGRIQYITDFTYFGDGYYAELGKELDFDFSYGVFQQLGREYPIAEAAQLFRIWQSNFCEYYQRQIFQVEVTSLG